MPSDSQLIADDPFGDMQDYVPFLTSIAKDKSILEIGTRTGVSTAAFLNGGGYVVSVDIDPNCADLFEHPRWTFICADSRYDPSVIYDRTGSVDILLIDGDHSYEIVKSDLLIYSCFVKSGGLILMHDVDLSEEALARCRALGETWPGEPRRVYDEFCKLHPDWPAEIKPGKWGLGCIQKNLSGERVRTMAAGCGSTEAKSA